MVRRASQILKPILTRLREQEQRVHEKRKAYSKWVENDPVFPSKTGRPIEKANLRAAFVRMLKRAGLPVIRFHDLRHTAASLMLNNGVPPLVVSKMLGHSRPSVTLDVYGHLLQHSQREAADLMGELVTPIEVRI